MSTPTQGQGVAGSINEPLGSTLGSNIDGPPAAAPVIAALEPDFAVAGDPATAVSVSGTGFTAASMVTLSGADVATVLESDGTLSVTVDPLAEGAIPVQVKNGTALSNIVDFTVDPSAPAATRKAAHKRKR